MSLRRLHPTVIACGLLALASSGYAQYKVVGPDGRVTYTDRPPNANTAGQVTTMRRDGSVAAESAQLPLELRQAVARFPVTLYTTAECAPCDAARRLLQARGVPYVERLISDDADSEQLLRLTDSRTVPVLTVGKQVHKVLSEGEWHTTLDLATYPRESRLPRNYRQPPASSLTTKAVPAPATRAEAAPRPETTPEPTPAPGAGPSIRF